MRAVPPLLVALIVAAGCKTSTGRDFDPAGVALLEVGVTTPAQLDELFGPPARQGDLRGAAGRTRVRYYQFAASDPDGARGRTLGVELADELVRGWLYDSSLEDDSTAFDIDARKQLVEGESTREDARALFGAPTGRFALPSNLLAQEFGRRLPEGELEVWAWRSSVTTRAIGLLNTRTRELALFFGADGVLSDQRYREH